MINIGSKQLKGISVGNRAVKEVYKGSQKIWAKESWINLSLSRTYLSVTSSTPDGSDSGFLVPSGTLEGDGLYGSYEWIVDFDVKWTGAWDSTTMYLEINNSKVYYCDDGSPISSAQDTFKHIHKQFIGKYNNLIKMSGKSEYTEIVIYRGSESYKSVAWSSYKKPNVSWPESVYIKNLSLTYKLVNS